MAYQRITWLPKVLRDAGIVVVLHDGWETRGLSTDRPFEPRAVVWHHDASPVGDSPGVPSYMIRNYETAGAQVWVDRQGRWHIIASGRAAHAGAVLAGKPDNYTSIGIETDHTSGEGWPDALLKSLRTGTAAIFRFWNVSVDALHFHKTICDPPGRKVDPAGLDLTSERDRVRAARAALPAIGGTTSTSTTTTSTATATAPTGPSVSLSGLVKAARIAGWSHGIANPDVREDVKVVRAALKAEGVFTYKGWQRKLGYTGADADGIPGQASLSELGRRRGFSVAA